MYNEKIINTNAKGLYEITDVLKKAILDSNVKDGVCVLVCQSSTSGIILTSNLDESSYDDIMSDMERIFPPRINYKNKEDFKKSAAHTISALYAKPLNIIINDFNALLGENQGVFVIDPIGNQKIKYGLKCL